jgi:hypothetical protein
LYPLNINKGIKAMSIKKVNFRLASIITAAAIALAALAASCGGPKTVAPKPDHEPELRANKANMMNRMDTTMNRRK